MKWLANTVAIAGTVMAIAALGAFVIGWWGYAAYVLMGAGMLLIAGGAIGALGVRGR